MAIALVVSNSVAGDNTHTVVTTSATNATGTTGIVFCAAYNLGTGTPSDSLSNTYTLISTITLGGAVRMSMWYCKNPTVSSSMTFSLTCTLNTIAGVTILCFSGTDKTTFYDSVTAQNSAISTTVQAGSVTPSRGSCIIVSAVGINGATTAPSVDSGFSSPVGVSFVAGNNFGQYSAFLVQSASSAVNPTWTVGTSSNLVSINAVFRSVNFVPQVGAFIVGI